MSRVSRAFIRRCARRARAEHWVERKAPAGFDARWRASVGGRELQRVRNIKPAFKHGLWLGLANAVLETALRGSHALDAQASAELDHAPIGRALTAALPKPDPPARLGHTVIPPRDRTAAVYLAATSHDEQQPVHLHVHDTQHLHRALHARVRQSLYALLPRGGVRDRRPTPTGTPPADQRGQLRALQSLRHQGSVRDHHLDDAGRRFGSKLQNL